MKKCISGVVYKAPGIMNWRSGSNNGTLILINPFPPNVHIFYRIVKISI